MSATAHVVTLLAIDDDPVSLELAKEALDQEGLEIIVSNDPRAGLEIATRRRPEIVLLDMIMPGMNGLEVLDRILEAAPETNVMLLTGHYTPELAVEAIRKGASDYLNKPVSLPLLRERVGQVVAEARQRQKTLELDREMLKACQFEGMVGPQPADAGGLRAHPPRRAALPHGAGHRLHRHRQGTGGARAAPPEPGGRQPHGGVQLLGDRRNAVRKRAVRLREGRLYRGEPGQDRPVRVRRRRARSSWTRSATCRW